MKHYNYQDDDVEVDEVLEDLLNVSSINIKFIFSFVLQLLARLEALNRHNCK